MSRTPARRRILIAGAIACVAAAAMMLASGHAQVEQAPVLATKILNFEIGSNAKQFGKLEFVGGLQLESDASGFGGFSGLRLYPDRSALMAVSDRCMVLTATLERDVTGALHDIRDPVLRSLPLDRQGKTLAKSRHTDCEALEIDDGDALIAFERNSQTGRFDIGPDGALTSFRPVWPKPGIGPLDRNRGIEAMAVFPPQSRFAGSVLSISESTLNGEGNHRAFITGPDGVSEFAIASRDGYSVTDADFLPDGDLVILERRFGLNVSPGMRLRRIAAASIGGGLTSDGDVLLEAGLAYRIDNMEGLDISAGEDGQVYLTLISDDNFFYFQSTLLLEFKLLGELSPVSGPTEAETLPKP
ncbi:MAG TPA: esterase-like activity of phytase family protein [Rhizobiaceae bacterium]|nr:esterase-like activity of phytase family protein [Rhizobiaceae bacterium]